MVKRLCTICFIFLLLIPSLHMQAWAQDVLNLKEIIITGSKIEEPLEHASVSATIITEQDIEKQHAITVGEVLKNVAGLDVIQSGGPGGLTDILIRGGNSKHALILIDGVRVNSPTTGNFDFADLPTAHIEKIEIVRGPYSALYGSDALCGVINIITKKGKDTLQNTLALEAGSFKTYTENYSLSGASRMINYSFSVSNQDSEGFSSAKDGDEKDGYKNTSVASRIGLDFSGSSTIDFSLRYNEANKDFDEIGQDNPSYIQETRAFISSLNVSQAIHDQWEHTLILSLVQNKSDNEDGINVWNNSEIETETRTIQWQHNIFNFNTKNTMIVGAEYDEQTGKYEGLAYDMLTFEYVGSEYDKTIVNKALSLQNHLNLLDETLFFTAGLRVDDHSVFGSEPTYKASLAYLFKDSGTKVRASWGTAFKAPTLNSLYWPDSGNPDLKPEKSKSYDIGIKKTIDNTHTALSLCFFHNAFEELIEWAPAPTVENPYRWIPQNVSRASTQGWEIETAFELFKECTIRANYTHTRTEDKIRRRELIRRPQGKTNLTVEYTKLPRLDLHCTLNFVGDRWNDVNNTEKIDAYTTIDIAAEYDINALCHLNGRIENVLDEDYVEVPGYGTAGISFYGGVKMTF